MDLIQNSQRWRSVESFEGEVWRVVDINNAYLVSNFGRVMSLKYGKETILKQRTIRSGYCVVSINGKHRTVHRLVANAFVPNPNNEEEVNHKDENKQNNTATNLEWCSHAYNMRYGTLIERMKQKNIAHPSTSFKVNQYDLDGNYLRTFGSVRDVYRQLKLRGYKKIYKCFSGVPVYFKGYIWQSK